MSDGSDGSVSEKPVQFEGVKQGPPIGPMGENAADNLPAYVPAVKGTEVERWVT